MRSGVQRSIVLAAALLLAPLAQAGQVSVTVDKVRNDSGQVRCGLFNTAESWRVEERALRTVVAGISAGRVVCDFGNVPEGSYSVAVFHAENGEERVSYGFLGKPRQGVGFSNNPSITFGAPDFAKAQVSVGSEPLTLAVEMKY